MNILSRQLIGNNQLLIKLNDSFKKQTLSNSIIFTGTKGIGKTTLAFFFINNVFNYLINDKISRHTNLIYNNSHPNVKYLQKEFDEKNNKFKTFINIQQIRNLENFLYQSSFNNLPKFILIDSADDLNNNAANSLLKALEEPKKNTYFILIAHQLSSLLPTLRSRCIKFYIDKPDLKQFTQILNLLDVFNDLDEVDFLYNLTNGSPGIALEIITKNIKELYLLIIEILTINEPLSSEVIKLADSVQNYSNEQFKIFLFLIRFILMTIIKINFGFNFKNSFYSIFHETIEKKAIKIENTSSLQILEYLNNNENDLFVYNLDKKIFSLNIFSSLKKKYE